MPAIITEGGHRRYTEEAYLQIVNKRFKLNSEEVESLNVPVDVAKVGAYRDEDATAYATRVSAEVGKLGDRLARYQEELKAVAVLQRTTSNPIMTSLLEKEFERIETHIAELTNDVSEITVDTLNTIYQHYSESILFDTTNEDRELLIGGALAPLTEYLLFASPAREGVKTHVKPINSKKMLNFALDFSELLRRIDFYYTSAGVPLKAIARKKNYV